MKPTPLLRTFIKFVTLNTLGMIGFSCYILADTFFVAKGLGTNGMAALNLAISLYCVVHAIGLLIGVGGATNYTILRAKNMERQANTVFTISICLAIVTGVLMMFTGIYGSAALSRLLGADQETFAMTNIYIKTLLSFSPFFIMNYVFTAFIQNDHAPKLAMGGMLLSSLSNILLDYVFIFPLHMGMFGAAFATGLSPMISLLFLSFHFIRRKNSFHFLRCRPSFCVLKDIISLGISSFVTEISSGAVLILFNLVVLGIAGNVGLAAYGIVANISLVVMSVFIGIAQGAQPLISQSYGRNLRKETTAVLRYSLILATAVSIVIYAVITLYSTEIIAIFNSEKDPLLRDYANSGLIIYFTGFFLGGSNIAVISFLSSCERAKEAFLLSMTRGLLAMIPLVLILPVYWGLTGVWLVFPIAETVTMLVTFIFILILPSYRHK